MQEQEQRDVRAELIAWMRVSTQFGFGAVRDMAVIVLVDDGGEHLEVQTTTETIVHGRPLGVGARLRVERSLLSFKWPEAS